MNTAEYNALRMNRDSRLLRTISDALALDLAVAPLLLMTEPGIGTIAATRGVADALGMEFVDVRSTHVDSTVFTPLPVLSGGTVVESKPRVEWLRGPMTRNRPCLVLLDESHTAEPAAMLTMLRWILDTATSPVVLVFHAGLNPSGEEIVLGWIEEALEIHRAHVPTTRLALSEHLKNLRQTINITGQHVRPVDPSGHLCDALMMHIDTPYKHIISVTILWNNADQKTIERFWEKANQSKMAFIRASIYNGQASTHHYDIEFA